MKGHCLPGSSIVGGYGRRRRSRTQGIDIGRRDYQTIREGGGNNKYKATYQSIVLHDRSKAIEALT